MDLSKTFSYSFTINVYFVDCSYHSQSKPSCATFVVYFVNFETLKRFPLNNLDKAGFRVPHWGTQCFKLTQQFLKLKKLSN